MPFFGNSWEYEKVYTRKEILRDISEHVEIEQLQSPDDSTSENYLIPSTGARFGVISTVSNSFCQGCSRLRLTADGKMKNCLFSNDETDLLTAMRQGQTLTPLIQENIFRKKKAAAGRIDFNHEKAAVHYAQNRSMIAIGG
jgi:cyclic pyranopterin phosphate synthase